LRGGGGRENQGGINRENREQPAGNHLIGRGGAKAPNINDLLGDVEQGKRGEGAIKTKPNPSTGGGGGQDLKGKKDPFGNAERKQHIGGFFKGDTRSKNQPEITPTVGPARKVTH